MIREAAVTDCAQLELLYRSLIPGNPDIHVQEERLLQLQHDPHNFCFVYDLEGIAAGTSLLHICLDVMFGQRPFALIENIVVDPEHRGRRIGQELIAHMEAHARSLRCTELYLLSSMHRTEAHRFFEQQGFSGTERRGFVKYLDVRP